MTLGRVAEAIGFAERSVEYADRSGDAFQRMGKRSTLADALHQAGRFDDAEERFQEAEAMQREWQPRYPLLYSLQGYRYCDLLLSRGRHEDVLRRATQTLEWITTQNWLLDMGLEHISLGRAALLAARSGRTEALDQARSHAQTAVDTLRQAGQQAELSCGLLARADVHRFTGDIPAARRDLAEAMALATRDPAGHMKLFETDCHLGYARLALDEGKPDVARQHLAAAETLIHQTGYRRREPELAELKEAVGPGE